MTSVQKLSKPAVCALTLEPNPCYHAFLVEPSTLQRCSHKSPNRTGEHPQPEAASVNHQSPLLRYGCETSILQSSAHPAQHT